LPIHEEDFVGSYDATSLPDRQRSAATVSLSRNAHGDGIDEDREPYPANDLSREGQNMFQHGDTARQIATIGEEACERVRRQHSDKLADMPNLAWVQAV
jgi:hypothetical protein